MSVMGFQEAYENSSQIMIDEDLKLIARVVTPESLFFLKLLAWKDRDHTIRKKDSIDIKTIFESYHDIPSVFDEISKREDLLDLYDDVYEYCGPHLLGEKVKKILNPSTYEKVKSILASDDLIHLINEIYGLAALNEDHINLVFHALNRGLFS